jgi:hypothetical protein
MRPVLFLHAGLAAALLLLSTTAFAQGACIPGQQVSCACPSGTSGIQVCADDGTHLGLCGCAAAPQAAAQFTPMQPQVSQQFYQGTPVMPGMHTERKGSTGLIVTGAVLLGIGYIAAAVVGAVALSSTPDNTKCSAPSANFVPFFGPSAFAASYSCDTYYPGDGFPSPGLWWALSTTDELMQFAGLALLITGAVVKHEVLVRDPGSFGWMVLPSTFGGGPTPGLGLKLSAWSF